MFLKDVEVGTGNFSKTTIDLGESTLSGSDLKFTYANRTLTDNQYGNLFATFNLPITTIQKNKYNTLRSSGGFLDTGFSGFNQDEIIFIEIPKNEYGELINGKSIKLQVPTGNSVSDVITIYSSYIEQNNYQNYFDTLYSDSSPESEQFGQPNPGSGTYESNVAFLFSDSIKTPQGDLALSWVTGFDTGNAFKTNNKEPFTFFDSDRTKIDEPVGIAFLDKGFIVLTHPTIVSNFPYSAATQNGVDLYSGDIEFNDLYFSASTMANIEFDSINTEYIQHVVCVASINEFYETSNPTFLEKYGSGGVGVESVYITEIGLYNADEELVAIVKPDRPIEKNKNQILLFDIQIKV